jgi:hypothetical protein
MLSCNESGPLQVPSDSSIVARWNDCAQWVRYSSKAVTGILQEAVLDRQRAIAAQDGEGIADFDLPAWAVLRVVVSRENQRLMRLASVPFCVQLVCYRERQGFCHAPTHLRICICLLSRIPKSSRSLGALVWEGRHVALSPQPQPSTKYPVPSTKKGTRLVLPIPHAQVCSLFSSSCVPRPWHCLFCWSC